MLVQNVENKLSVGGMGVEFVKHNTTIASIIKNSRVFSN